MPIKYNLDLEKSKLVELILTNNQDYLNNLANKYQRFLATRKGVPIFTRTFTDETKVNNTINNDFVGEVVDTKVGYMISIPVTYTYNVLTSSDEKPNIDSEEQELIDQFVLKQDLADINLETVKMTSICGTSPRLCYIDKQGQPAVLNLKPWEVIYVYNNSETELLLSARYYIEISADENNEKTYTLKAQLYDKKYVYYFTETAYTKIPGTREPMFVPDTTVVESGVELHGFDEVPLVEYVNNEERQADCDKVLKLIDVYDRCLSDETSEIEQFRLAYLALYGLDATPEELAKMKQTGAFKMTADGRVEFITKKLDATALENLLKQLEENIIKFAKSTNFSDKNFFGNLSGIAIKYKLIKLEHKCAVAEIKMKKADYAMWQLLSQVYAKRSMYFDAYKIKRTFTRKIPVNTLEEARIQRELKGLVSTETRLSLAPFVDNPSEEIKRIQKELKDGTLLAVDTFYDIMEETNSGEGTFEENEEFNEWRREHRQSGNAPEAINGNDDGK